MDYATETWQALARLRETAPLVQNITNYVAMDVAANTLLALGASPAMAHAVEEVEEFVGIAQALALNIGTLSPAWVQAMQLAAARALQLGKPWVLDPVGAGATQYRTRTAAALARQRPTVVRGNASEILALAGTGAATKGVDSTAASDDAREVARRLAAELGCVVAVTGAVDYVTDGRVERSVANGHPLMTRVTALGCSATAMVAAFCAVEDDALVATAQALAVLGLAGELAARQAAGPGSLRLHLLDALYRLDEATVTAGVRIG